jgi:hypothetical protein
MAIHNAVCMRMQWLCLCCHWMASVRKRSQTSIRIQALQLLSQLHRLPCSSWPRKWAVCGAELLVRRCARRWAVVRAGCSEEVCIAAYAVPLVVSRKTHPRPTHPPPRSWAESDSSLTGIPRCARAPFSVPSASLTSISSRALPSVQAAMGVVLGLTRAMQL